MKENHKKRLDTIQKIVSPARAKELSEYCDEELLEIILDGWEGIGKDSGPLTVQGLTDEKLVEIIMEGRRNERKSKEAD